MLVTVKTPTASAMRQDPKEPERKFKFCIRMSPKVNWFHSGMTEEFRESEIHALLMGDIFGNGATDAAGMVSLLL